MYPLSSLAAKSNNELVLLGIRYGGLHEPVAPGRVPRTAADGGGGGEDGLQHVQRTPDFGRMRHHRGHGVHPVGLQSLQGSCRRGIHDITKTTN